MAQKSIISLLQKYLSMLKEEGIIIDKAFLFGSYATNSQTIESDIDLMIISKQFDKADDLTYGKIWALTKRVNSKIEPYIIGLEKFNHDNVSPIIHEVKNHGLEIAC